MATLRTPRLDIHSHDRLGNSLGLGLLLLAISLQALLSDLSSLCVLLLVLVTAEQVDIVVVILLLSLGRVESQVARLGAVDGVGLRSIAGQSSKLALKGSDVLVPSSGVRELGRVGRRLESLEGGNIGLGRGVAAQVSALMLHNILS